MTTRARASALTRRLSAELEQAWMVISQKDEELKAAYAQARHIRELLAQEAQRRVQAERSIRPNIYGSQTENDIGNDETRRLQMHILQLKEQLRTMGEALDVAHMRIAELSNQHSVAQGQRPHLVSDNTTGRRNRNG